MAAPQHTAAWPSPGVNTHYRTTKFTTKLDISAETPDFQAFIESDADMRHLFTKRYNIVEEWYSCDIANLPKEAKYKEHKASQYYPDFLKRDNSRQFPMASVFEYRGRDIPIECHYGSGSKKGKVFEKGHAVLQFQDVANAPNKGVFGFPHGSAGGLHHQRIIEVQFGAETQMPSTIIRIKNGDKPVRVEIFAGSLARASDSVGIKFAHGSNPAVRDGMPNMPALDTLANDGLLLRTDLILYPIESRPKDSPVSKPIWYNITEAERDELERKFDEGEELSYAEQVIVCLCRSRHMTAYRGVKQEMADRLDFFCTYMRSISYATAWYGYNWWYRVVSDGVPFDSKDYPFMDLDPSVCIPLPRWLITRCKVHEVTRWLITTYKSHGYKSRKFDNRVADYIPLRIQPFQPYQLERDYPTTAASAWQGTFSDGVVGWRSCVQS